MTINLGSLFGEPAKKAKTPRRKEPEEEYDVELELYKKDEELEPCSYSTGRHNTHKGIDCGESGPSGAVCTRRDGHSDRHHAMGAWGCLGEWG
jgi:hypothetical protein